MRSGDEDHLTAELAGLGDKAPVDLADETLAMKMIQLAGPPC